MNFLVGILMLTAAQGPVEKQVTFTGAGGLELYGTLTVPANSSGRSVPGVLLLPGSGPSDRNGNQPPSVITDILKQVSDTLAASGIETLRFDKRATKLYVTKFPKDRSELADFFKWENFVGDATAAVRYLGSLPGVDSKRIAVIGHSEGAEIALQIGSNLAKDPAEPAALVTLGGAGRRMGPILNEQIARALDKQNALPPVRKQYMDNLNEVIDQVIKDGTFPEKILPGLKPLFNITTTKLMRSYFTIDPAELAKNYPGPVLIINGGSDTQVSPERDSPRLKDALQSRRSGSVEMLIVPNASHNLKATTASNADVFEGPVDPLALAKIKQFLVKQLHP